jgi:hypothetical protein
MQSSAASSRREQKSYVHRLHNTRGKKLVGAYRAADCYDFTRFDKEDKLASCPRLLCIMREILRAIVNVYFDAIEFK